MGIITEDYHRRQGTTVTEDYVSYEIAQLLKEKRFDVPCMGRYSVRSKEFHLDCTRLCNNGGLFECAAPTLQMAHKWLSEEHGLFPMVQPEPIGIYSDGKWDWAGKWIGVIAKLREKDVPIQRIGSFDKCQEACEETIKYCLENLI